MPGLHFFHRTCLSPVSFGVRQENNRFLSVWDALCPELGLPLQTYLHLMFTIYYQPEKIMHEDQDQFFFSVLNAHALVHIT